MQTRLAELYVRVKAFQQIALERWTEQGFDDIAGGFVEALDFNGQPLYDLPKRLRVQARQIYVCALATASGYGQHYVELAQQAYDFMATHYWHEQGGWVMSTDRYGHILDAQRYAYEQAFVLLALSELIPLSNNKNYQQALDNTWQFLTTQLAEPTYGGFFLSSERDVQLPRQQNPHMHLFEACLNLYRRSGNSIWLARAEELYQLFEQHFFDPQQQCLREFFSQDWQPHPHEGDHLEPGHHYEWTWLLGQYAKHTGRILESQDFLYEYANRFGTDGSSFAVDEILPQGRPSRTTKRLWVQTETLKAHLAMLEKTGAQHLWTIIIAHIEAMFNEYLCEKQGGWYDQLDTHNMNISTQAPASTLYHLFLSFEEFLRVANQ